MHLNLMTSAGIAAAVCAGLLAACAAAPDEVPSAAVVQGEEMATRLCATCHSVGRSGESPHPDAVRFRELSDHYPVSSLEEALAEGISVGHPDMPAFELSPDEIEALLKYIESIQEKT